MFLKFLSSSRHWIHSNEQTKHNMAFVCLSRIQWPHLLQFKKEFPGFIPLTSQHYVTELITPSWFPRPFSLFFFLCHRFCLLSFSLLSVSSVDYHITQFLTIFSILTLSLVGPQYSHDIKYLHVANSLTSISSSHFTPELPTYISKYVLGILLGGHVGIAQMKYVQNKILISYPQTHISPSQEMVLPFTTCSAQTPETLPWFFCFLPPRMILQLVLLALPSKPIQNLNPLHVSPGLL